MTLYEHNDGFSSNVRDVLNAIRFLHFFDYKRNLIKPDLLNNRFFISDENGVAFDIKILKNIID